MPFVEMLPPERAVQDQAGQEQLEYNLHRCTDTILAPGRTANLSNRASRRIVALAVLRRDDDINPTIPCTWKDLYRITVLLYFDLGFIFKYNTSRFGPI